MKAVTTHQAKTHLSALLREVESGEEIHILRGEVPVAKLVPIDGARERRRPPVGKITSACVHYSHDVFKPLSEAQMKEWGLL